MYNLLSDNVENVSNYSVLEPYKISKCVFDIENKPLYLDGVETDYNALIKKDTRDILYVGKGYGPLANSDVLDRIFTTFGNDYQLIRITNYNDRRFEFIYENDNGSLKVGPEEGKSTIIVKNSYDGSTSLSIFAGMYIKICGNGAIGLQGHSIVRKHTKNIPNWYNIELPDFNTITIKNRMSENNFSITDEKEILSMFEKLTSDIPKPKNSIHPSIMLLNRKFQEYNADYNMPEFSLFMAATWVTTYGQDNSVPYSYIKSIERQVSKLWLN